MRALLPISLVAAALLLVAAPAQAQSEYHADPARAAEAPERTLVESALSTLVGILQETSRTRPSGDLGDRLRQMARDLNGAAQPFATRVTSAPSDDPPSYDTLRDLLAEARHETRQLRREAQRAGDDAAADDLYRLERALSEALRVVRRLDNAPTDRAHARWEHRDDHRDWTDDVEETAEDTADAIEAWAEDLEDRIEARVERIEERVDRRVDRRTRRHEPAARPGPFDDPFGDGTISATVGDWERDWPYQTTALYRPIPALRYNRVEGFVLGFGLAPLDWYDRDRTRLYGQLGYAFGLEDWRYEVGFEARPGGREVRETSFKLGAAYRRNTVTDDLWKLSWSENSLASFFFENDFFEYYQTEGWTVYGVQRLSRYGQVSVGYRNEEHRALERVTHWSLFDGDGFRDNLGAIEGRLSSVVVALEGGRVRDFREQPRGAAIRLEAEFADGFGGDFAFNRYVGDARLYLPVTPISTLSLRLRGGTATGTLPLQKQFTLGGQGSVRAYPQNLFLGTRMLLANAEYAIGDVPVIDYDGDDFDADISLLVYGFADAGWTNSRFGDEAFDLDDVLPSAGFGVGLGGRALRVELAWPLRDVGFGQEPSLWLRLNPAF